MKKNQTDGTTRDEFVLTGSNAIDLGIVINATNMAAGATAQYTVAFDTSWVRNIIMLSSSDQQYDIQFYLTNKDGTQAAYTPAATQAANGPGFRPHQLVGAQAIVGGSLIIKVKNSSASANTYAKLSLQLLGL